MTYIVSLNPNETPCVAGLAPHLADKEWGNILAHRGSL